MAGRRRALGATLHAEVAELVDALDSKSSGAKPSVSVRLRPSALRSMPQLLSASRKAGWSSTLRVDSTPTFGTNVHATAAKRVPQSGTELNPPCRFDSDLRHESTCQSCQSRPAKRDGAKPSVSIRLRPSLHRGLAAQGHF